MIVLHMRTGKAVNGASRGHLLVDKCLRKDLGDTEIYFCRNTLRI